MKTNYLLSILVLSLLITSCRKEKNTDYFPDTTYKTLGTFNKNGLPDYLVQRDVISPGLQSFINEYLVDQRNLVVAHPELFTKSAIGDITITKPTTVYMTFVHQDTDGKNSFGFYTYPTDNPPKSSKEISTITYAFPNIGNSTPLKSGDKVKLGRFETGTSLGFVLIVNGWDQQAGSFNKSAVHYCTDNILNPESDPGLKKHAALIFYAPENKVLIGFEDQNRMNPGCDHDFNDAVIYCTLEY